MSSLNRNIIAQIIRDDIEFFVSDVEHVIVNVAQCLIDNLSTPDLGLWDVPGKKEAGEKYYKVSVPKLNDDLFREQFRMSRSSFEALARVVCKSMKGNKDSLWKKVMFTMWCLAKVDSYEIARERFGYGKSTATKIFQQIISVISRLQPKYVKFPDPSKFNMQARIFQRRNRGFPGVVGTIGCDYIRIKAANNEDPHDSVVLQATCDHKGRFMHISIGMPDETNISAAFEQTDLFKKLTDDTTTFLQPHLHLAGNASFPLLQNLMTPFEEDSFLNSHQINFNDKLKSCRSILLKAFCRLKARFGILEYLDMDAATVRDELIVATCVLHNFLVNQHEEDFECTSGQCKEIVEEEYKNNSTIENIAAVSKRRDIADKLVY